MNTLINLITLYNRLDDDSTHKQAIRQILTHLDEAADATIYDLVEITHSSRTTLWRIFNLMGYNNYPDFRKDLASQIHQTPYYNWALPHVTDLNNFSISDMSVPVLHKTKTLVSKYLSEQLVVRIVDMLYGASGISFYDLPFRSSVFLIQNLFLTGKRVTFCSLYPEMEKDSNNLSEDCVVFSLPLDYPDMMDMTSIYKTVKEHHATLILCCPNNSRYNNYGSIKLFSGAPSELTKGTDLLYAYEMTIQIISDIYRNKYVISQKTD